jgi:hypothetical protein
MAGTGGERGNKQDGPGQRTRGQGDEGGVDADPAAQQSPRGRGAARRTAADGSEQSGSQSDQRGTKERGKGKNGNDHQTIKTQSQCPHTHTPRLVTNIRVTPPPSLSFDRHHAIPKLRLTMDKTMPGSTRSTRHNGWPWPTPRDPSSHRPPFIALSASATPYALPSAVLPRAPSPRLGKTER